MSEVIAPWGTQVPNRNPQAIKRVGVIGGGQLAWMMAEAAKPLGIELIVQTPHSTDPAVAIAADHVLAAIDDSEATARLAGQCDVITFENEFINLEALAALEHQGVRFHPSLASLSPLLDKYDQRRYLEGLGLPTPRFTLLEGQLNEKILADFGFPVVLKARRHGYDGQGTFIISNQAELAATWQRLGQPSMLLEEFVPFDRELAVIAARSAIGDIVTYPIAETQQEAQVCRRVLVPAALEPSITTQIAAIARKLLDALQVVGVFGIELFLTTDGKVLVNEVSPRTHNSGHFTIEACDTSQFEQQLRAVCHLPLGRPDLRCDGAVMVNLLGYEHAQSDYLTKRQQLAEIPQAQVHWYGKTESRPGRKLGHVTVLFSAASPTEQRAEALKIAQIVESTWYS